VDERRQLVEDLGVSGEEPSISRIALCFLRIPLARGFSEDIELSLRSSSGNSGIGRKAKDHTAGQPAAAAG